MIYDKSGRPLGEVLIEAGLRLNEQRLRQRLANYMIDPKSSDPKLKRAYRIGHDVNGDVFPIFRVGVRHRPGRGYAERQAAKCA